MKKCILSAAALLLAAMLLPATAEAQSSSESRRGADSAEESSKVALGIGVGIVKPESDSDMYLTASLRFRIGEGWEDEDDRRSYNRRGDRGIRGYLEPEIGYWKQDGTANRPDTEDLLLGVNLLGVVPTRNAEYFIGVGFGVHFIDTEFTPADTSFEAIDDSDTAIGANLQVGLDVNISQNVALFGVGRFDLVEDVRDETQLKVYGGLRFKF
ncbi:MAG: hypothetical protein AAGD01_15415 [Acidobacteriota bacterium]